MRDERHLHKVSQPTGADVANSEASAAMFAAADWQTARSILLRVGRTVVPVLPRVPVAAMTLALVLAIPSTGRAQSAIQATASASARILPSSVRLSGGTVTVDRGRHAAVVTVIAMTPPPVLRLCDTGESTALCRMLVVDLP